MYHFFVEPGQIEGNRIRITGGDYNHIKNVLRLKAGEELAVSNGIDKREYRCGIEGFTEDTVLCTLRFIREEGVELVCPVTLYQGIPKGDKMELIIQKAVELGAVRVVPVAMKRCVVRLDEKKAAAKRERWQAIARAAAKQSRRAVVPQIALPMSFQEAAREAAEAEVALLPYELEDGFSHTRELLEGVQKGQSISVMIGPEGGFDEEEIAFADNLGLQRITLGKRILRTETAGMVMLSVLMYELEKRQDETGNLFG